MNPDPHAPVPPFPLRVLMLAPERVTGGITTWFAVLRKFSRPSSVQFRVVDTSKLYEPLGMKPGIRSVGLGLWTGFRRGQRLLREVDAFVPDLVYMNVSPSWGFIVRDCAYLHLLRRKGVPVVVHFRGGDSDGFFGKGPVRAVTRGALRTARLLLTITPEVGKAAETLVDPSIVKYIPNMVDDEQADGISPHPLNPGPACRILFVGWHAPGKGTLELIRSMALTPETCSCRFVGPGAESHIREMKALVDELGLGHRVTLTGPVSREQLEPVYREADVFVLPSWSEGFPNTVLEAMMYGLPVVGTDVGNIREMIGADTSAPAGILLEGRPPVAPGLLAEVLAELARNPDRRAKLGRAGFGRVRDLYRASRVVPELETMLRAVHDSSASVREGRGP